MEILAVENLSFTYPNCEEKALDGISFSVEKGEFITLCGATGCGKSTLLRLLKREIAPLGEVSGRITIKGRAQETLGTAESARLVGFVMQDPERQLVTDKVWHELAFGLENLGTPQAEIRRRVAETSEYFGISGWFDRDVAELSGGQKQLMNLAAVMAMQPELLILDEPTAQLDPIAAADFISTLKKLNRELGQTIIIAEHRLEDVIPACDRMMVMQSGRLPLCAGPESAAARISEIDGLSEYMPAAVRLFGAVREAGDGRCPLTVREGAEFLAKNFRADITSLPEEKYAAPEGAALEFREVWFRYGKNLPDVLRGTSFSVGEGEIFCLLGSNGSGKSTALGNAAGLLRPYSGTIKLFGRRIDAWKWQELYKNNLALLPQDVQTVFLKDTVREELAECGGEERLPQVVREMLGRRKGLYGTHPYDLSGGEQQLVALAKVLSSSPRLLLLDEPTKGIDARAKGELAALLGELRRGGMTVLIVTHDVEFAARVADRCAMFFRGEVISGEPPRTFFDKNNFYTTAVNRMTRGLYSGVVTVEQAAELCRLNGRRSASDDSDTQ